MTQRKSKHRQTLQKQVEPTMPAFDVWLQKGLHELYDGIAQEPVPDELIRLIEEDRKR